MNGAYERFLEQVARQWEAEGHDGAREFLERVRSVADSASGPKEPGSTEYAQAAGDAPWARIDGNWVRAAGYDPESIERLAPGLLDDFIDSARADATRSDAEYQGILQGRLHEAGVAPRKVVLGRMESFYQLADRLYETPGAQELGLSRREFMDRLMDARAPMIDAYDSLLARAASGLPGAPSAADLIDPGRAAEAVARERAERAARRPGETAREGLRRGADPFPNAFDQLVKTAVAATRDAEMSSKEAKRPGSGADTGFEPNRDEGRLERTKPAPRSTEEADPRPLPGEQGPDPDIAKEAMAAMRREDIGNVETTADYRQSRPNSGDSDRSTPWPDSEDAPGEGDRDGDGVRDAAEDMDGDGIPDHEEAEPYGSVGELADAKQEEAADLAASRADAPERGPER